MTKMMPKVRRSAGLLGVLAVEALLALPTAAANFEIEAGRALASKYLNRNAAVTIVVGDDELKCALTPQGAPCTVPVPRDVLMTDVEVKLTDDATAVFGEANLAFEPFRFTLTPADNGSVIRLRIAPAAVRYDTRAVLELAATPLPTASGELHAHFQRARAAWVAQSQTPGALKTAYGIRAAFVLIQAASRMAEMIPTFRADQDLEVRAAQEFVKSFDDRKLNWALGKGNAKHARVAVENVFLARANPLSRAWQYLKTQPVSTRLALLDQFEAHFRSTIPAGSEGEELVRRVRLTLPDILMAQVHALTAAVACGQIARADFNTRAESLLDSMGSRIRGAGTNNAPEWGDICLERAAAIDKTKAPRQQLDYLCLRTRELADLRYAARIELKCPEMNLQAGVPK